MKAINQYVLFLAIATLSVFQSCEMNPDPGFDGSIKGTVLDSTNLPVYSDILTNNLIINALGEGDLTPTVIRVNGEGKFSYSKLFPKNYKISVKGPAFIVSPDTARLNFTGGNSLEQNFVVVPYLNISVSLVASPTDSTISLSYTVVGNRGKVPTTREIYCSTAPYPTKSIGTSAYYSTTITALTTNTGTKVITGLKWGTKYFVRIGANGKTGSANDLMNYSNQLIVQTPKK